MNERPELNKELDAITFRNFYYLKQELIDFCRENGQPTSGDKIELTDRIATFLDTGKAPAARKSKRKAANISLITDETAIEENVVFSERHRAFFKEKIGKSFSFNVPFQKWLKSNAEKTYGEAVQAYHKIIEEKKRNKTEIGRQFEYNTYIRDFFADNCEKSLNEAIVCWKYKKSLPGHHKYERSDLVALSRQEPKPVKH